MAYLKETVLLIIKLFDYASAMHSISQRTPFGRSLTAKQLLAGFEIKYFAYTSLNAAKSAISARKQVVLTTLSIPEPAASSIAATFLQLCSVCAVIPSGTSPFSGLTGICPDVKTSPFVINPCEYGPIAPGAFFVSIIDYRIYKNTKFY